VTELVLAQGDRIVVTHKDTDGKFVLEYGKSAGYWWPSPVDEPRNAYQVSNVNDNQARRLRARDLLPGRLV
jgi:hypothetical protein